MISIIMAAYVKGFALGYQSKPFIIPFYLYAANNYHPIDNNDLKIVW